MLPLVLALLGVLSPALAKVEVMQYGQYGGLTLVCGRGELILVESEQLGYSETDGECRPRPMCSVPYTLARWYCRGKSTCTGMQVERRPLHKRTCGSDFTNCLRVEYQCIKKKKLVDVCDNVYYKIPKGQGYLSSPGFPEMYPPQQNCTCSLTAENDDFIQVSTPFFLLKSTKPCNDWLKLRFDGGKEEKKCGYVPEMGPYVGREIDINFRSDRSRQDMGFWLMYKAVESNDVILRCGKYAQETPKKKRTKAKTTKAISTTKTTTISTTTTTPATSTSTTTPTTTASTTTMATRAMKKFAKELPEQRRKVKPTLSDLFRKSSPVKTFRDKFSKVGKRKIVREPEEPTQSRSPWGSTETDTPWFFSGRKAGPNMQPTEATVKEYVPSPVKKVYRESQTYRPPPIEELMKDMGLRQKVYRPPPVETLVKTTTTMASTKAPIPTAPSEPKQAVVPSKDEFEPPVLNIKMPAIQEHYLPPPMFKAAEPQPPVQKYQHPVEEYQPPLQKYQPPVEEYNPPVPEFKPSINEFNQPMSDFKSPVNEFKPPANEFKPPPMKGFKIPDQNYKPEEYMPPLPEYHPPMPAYKPPPPEELFRDQLIPTEIQIEQQEEETVGVINGVPLDNYLTPEKEQAFDSFAKETTTMEVPIVTDPVQVTEESQATTVSDVVVNDAEPPMIPWNQQLLDGKVQPVLEKEKVAVEEGIKGFPGVPVSSYDEEWGMWGMPVGPKDGPTDELANNIGNYASNYYNYDEYYNGELNPRVETIPKQPSTSAPTDTTTPKAVENVDFMMTKKEKNDLTPPWDEFPQNFFSAMKAPSDMAPEGEMPPPVQEDDMMYVPPLEELIPIESFGSKLDQDPYGVLNEEMSADDGMDGFFSFGDEVPVGQLFGEELETVPQPKAINDLFPGLMAWNAKEGLEEGPVEPMGLQEAETSSTTTTESTTSSTTTSTTTTLPTTTVPTTTPTTTTASTTSTTTTQATTTTTLPTTTTTTLPTTIRTTTITPTTSTTVPTSTVTPTTSTTIPTTTTTDSTTTTPTTTTTATTTITTTTEAEEADVFGMILGEENIGLTLPEDANQIESNLLLADSGVGEPELIQLQPEEQPLLEPVYFWGDEGVIGGLDMDTTPTSIDSLFPDAMVTGRLEPVNNVNLHDDSIDWVLGPVVEDTFPETSTDEVVTEDPWGPATNSPWDHEERETTRKWWEIPTMPEHPFKGTHIREYPDVPVITEVEEDIVGVVGKEGMPVELPDNLRELDPEIYMKIKDYISSNQRVSQPSQISQSYDNAMANNIAEKSSPHTFWVLIAVGIIGWMVFLVMVGLLIYYRREKARPTRRMKPYSSPHSTIPSHLMFPSLSNLSASPTLTIPSSAGSLGAEINARAYGMDEFPHNAIRPGHREVPIDVPFEYMGYPVQPSPRPSMGDAATTVCHSPIPSSSVSTMIGVGGMEDRPLPPIPHPIGRDVTEGTQTRDETNACTQTDKNSSTQTDNGTVRSNASTASYESLTKFDKRTPIKRKSSPGSCSEDDTNATYSSIDTLMKKADNANRKSFRSLNSTNISSWVFSTMNKAAANLSPKKEKNKDKIKNKKSKKHQQPEISSPMPLQTPTGVTALKSYPQVSTPFLSVKDKQKVEQLPGQGENVGLTEWKSVSTLNTEHSGDSEAIYNQLNKIAMVYNDLPSQDGESLSEASTSSPESSPNMFHRDFKIPPPVPPKSPYIHMSRSSEQLNTIKEDSEKEDGGSVKERSKIFTMINV